MFPVPGRKPCPTPAFHTVLLAAQLLAALPARSGTGSPEAEPPYYRGTVVNALTHGPIQGVQVVMANMYSGRVIETRVTEAAGPFAFSQEAYLLSREMPSTSVGAHITFTGPGLATRPGKITNLAYPETLGEEGPEGPHRDLVIPLIRVSEPGCGTP